MWQLIKGGSDSWSLPVCDWSLRWKRCFEEPTIEVPITKDGMTHIADVLTEQGVVLKFQKRWLQSQSIQERERFFGKMVWIFNAKGWDIDLYKHEKANWVEFEMRLNNIALQSCTMPIFLDIGNDKLYWFNWQLFSKQAAQLDLRQGVMRVFTKKEIIIRYKKATPPSDQTKEEQL